MMRESLIRIPFRLFSQLPLRPPVVTIMGHVDHGKTTILDYLRKSSVAASEAGGITQHIGAFSVNVASPSGGPINRLTFLDTPGHAAFSRIRERGAKVTDIVVLVISADDGIMAQTVESIKFIRESGVPIVVAINKCDKFGDRANRIKEELLRHEVICEDFGGETQSVAVSGLTGLNMDKLLEALLLQGELLELRADPNGLVEGAIIESRMNIGLGECATILIQNGTLRPGIFLVAEDAIGKVRAMRDYAGRTLQEAPPSMPVEVAGWKSLPRVGAAVFQVASEIEAEKIAKTYIQQREEDIRRSKLSLLKEREIIHDKMWEVKQAAKVKGSTIPLRSVLSYEEFAENVDERPVLSIIVKSDVIGSQEAIDKVIEEIASEKVRVNIISNTVGPVTENDIKNAKYTNAKLFTFGLKTPKMLIRLAQKESVDFREFSIIYRFVDHLNEALLSLLPDEIQEKAVGNAAVLQLFSFDKLEQVIGCRVDDGVIYKSREGIVNTERSCKDTTTDKLHRAINTDKPHRVTSTDKYAIQLARESKILWTGRISTMRHLKKDILNAGKGLECGIILENCPVPVIPGDRLICIERTAIRPNL